MIPMFPDSGFPIKTKIKNLLSRSFLSFVFLLNSLPLRMCSGWTEPTYAEESAAELAMATCRASGRRPQTMVAVCHSLCPGCRPSYQVCCLGRRYNLASWIDLGKGMFLFQHLFYLWGVQDVFFCWGWGGGWRWAC